MSYVWAYGLRNPFGLKAVGGALFATHNGPDLDSFLRIERGRNYLWDGTDWSIGSGADVVFSPSLSPVHLDYYPTGSTLFPGKYREGFFLAVAGHGPFRTGSGWPAGVIALPYDLAHHRVRETPRYFVRYQGKGQQLVAALAFGPDGLYFAPLLPNQKGETPVIRVSFDPRAHYPYTLEAGALALIQHKGCLSCHELYGQGSTVAPSLDYDSLKGRLTQRLLSENYARALKSQHDPTTQRERAAVLKAKGDERLHVWVRTQILDPGFDNPSNQMPNLGLTPREADTIATYLIGSGQATPTRGSGVRGLALRVYRGIFGEPTPMGAAFVGLGAGVALALVLGLVTFGIWRLRSARAVRRLSGGA